MAMFVITRGYFWCLKWIEAKGNGKKCVSRMWAPFTADFHRQSHGDQRSTAGFFKKNGTKTVVLVPFTGWWFGTFFCHSFGNGMSSSQLTFSPSFFRGVGWKTTNQDICSHGSQKPPSRKNARTRTILEPGSPIHNLPGPVNIQS